MAKGKKKGKKGGAVVSYDSDDERKYVGEAVPDPSSADYYQDDVDAFHANRDKILLDSGKSLATADSSSEEEEVLAVAGDESSDDDEEILEYKERLRQLRRQGFKEKLGSDIEDEDEEDGLPDEKAWGKKRSMYYDADADDSDDLEGSDEEAALEEEKEALAIQQKLAEQLDDQDFGLDIFEGLKKSADEKSGKKEEVIQKDLSKLTKREKLQLLEKQSPELLEMIKDFKRKMTELQERILPVYRVIKSGKLPTSKGTEYVCTKLKLNMDYCINITFYLTLKAKQTPVHNHPVITRLLQFRKLFKQLESLDQQMVPVLQGILQKVERGEELCSAARLAQKSVSKKTRVERGKKVAFSKDKRKLSDMMSDPSDEDTLPPTAERGWGEVTGGRSHGRKKVATDDRVYETTAEKEALEHYKSMKGGKKEGAEEEPGAGDRLGEQAEVAPNYEEGYYGEEEDGKREITYEMMKNKGLTPKRNKLNRNPRVKNRMKYRKANIRRKGQIREVRKEMDRYGGEISGIRAGVKRGIKLK